MKENILKGLVELKKRFANIRELCQKLYIVMFQMILLIKYNKTFHKAIKIKPTDVKRDSYSDQNVDSNEKDPKFKIGDHVRLLRYKTIFAKGYAPN